MKRTLTLAVVASALAASTALAQATPVTAFVDVTTIPMDRERTVPRQTVVVRGDRIVAVGPVASTQIPDGAQRIDGRGKFLMPGLAEMHAHVLGPQAAGNADEQLNKDIFFLYVANGITTIRAMLGAPNQLVLRERLAKNELLGPTMFVAAPSLNGNSAPDPATAIGLVRAHKQNGYDLLKIHPQNFKPETYDAIVRTAREVDITWGGHVPPAVGIDHVLEVRQSTIDHLDGYIEGAVSDAMKRRIASPTDTVTLPEMWRSVTEDKLRAYARRTKELGIWNIPTQFLWESFNTSSDGEEWARREEMKYAPRQWVTNWVNQKKQRNQFDAQQRVTPADGQLHISLRRKMLKALADAGAPLLMGTDSPQMFNVPGFALHRELRVAVAAGLTTYQVLESGTKNVGIYAARELKKDGNFGTVTVGSRADLVLLDANPLLDIGNLTQRSGVMVRGRWVPRGELDAGLQAIAARYAGASAQ